MYKVTKKFTFDAAHRLYGHPGLCNNIHGHTYTVHVKVKSEIKDLNEQEMVVDFGELKQLIKINVVDALDHALILNENDPIFQTIRESEKTLKLVSCKANPTAEYLAKIIFDTLFLAIKVSDLLIQLVGVVVFETANSYAEYTIN